MNGFSLHIEPPSYSDTNACGESAASKKFYNLGASPLFLGETIVKLERTLLPHYKTRTKHEPHEIPPFVFKAFHGTTLVPPVSRL